MVKLKYKKGAKIMNLNDWKWRNIGFATLGAGFMGMAGMFMAQPDMFGALFLSNVLPPESSQMAMIPSLPSSLTDSLLSARPGAAPEPEHAASEGGGRLSATPPRSQTGGGTGAAPAADCVERMRSLGVLDNDPEACLDLDGVINQLQTGTYAYNKPDTMLVDRTVPVSLVLETAKGQDAISGLSSLPGEVVSTEAKFGRVVVAKLTGTDFEIKPRGEEKRTVTTAAPVEWVWDVTPKSTGDKVLTIEVAVEVTKAGQPVSTVQLKVLRETIPVTATRLQKVTAFLTSVQGMATLLTGILVAVAGGFGAWRKICGKGGGKDEEKEDEKKKDGGSEE